MRVVGGTLYACKGVVTVYGFFTFYLNPVPDDAVIGFKAVGCPADHIFNEQGVFIRLFRNKFFVRTLEQGVNGSGTGFFRHVNETFKPLKAPQAKSKAYGCALSVRAGIADGL